MFNLKTLIKFNQFLLILLNPLKSLLTFILPHVNFEKLFKVIKSVITLFGLLSFFISVPIVIYLDPIDYLMETLSNCFNYFFETYHNLIKKMFRGLYNKLGETLNDVEVNNDSVSTKLSTAPSGGTPVNEGLTEEIRPIKRAEYITNKSSSSNQYDSNYIIVGGIIILVIGGAFILVYNHEIILNGLSSIYHNFTSKPDGGSSNNS